MFLGRPQTLSGVATGYVLLIFLYFMSVLYIYIYMNYEWTIKDDDHFQLSLTLS